MQFKVYLRKAQPYLPRWWAPADSLEIVRLATTDDDYLIKCATDKEDIQRRYSNFMPASMRMFYEQFATDPESAEARRLNDSRTKPVSNDEVRSWLLLNALRASTNTRPDHVAGGMSSADDHEMNEGPTTAWQYPMGTRRVVTVPSWARNLPPDELSDDGHEGGGHAQSDPSPRRPNNPPRRSLSSVFRQNRSASFSSPSPNPATTLTSTSTALSPTLAHSTASTSSSSPVVAPPAPAPDSIRAPEPTHPNPASTTIHRSTSHAPGGDKGWWTFTLPSKYLDRVHGYIHPKEWNEKGKDRADHPHLPQAISEEDDDARSITSQRSMRSGWSIRSARRASRNREQDKQDYHRKMTQSMKINLGPPNIFSINQATTPGWASPWAPFERSQEDRRMQDPFDVSQQQTAAVEASRKSRFENFILHNPFSPLFFRIINLVLVTCTLALAGHIRRQEERAGVVGVIGTSTLFVLVIAPIAIIHIFITLYIEYFGAPIGLWQIRTKMFYTLTDLVLICLYSSALSLSLDDLFTSSLECTAYTPYRRYNNPSPSVVGSAGIDGTLANEVCAQQIAQVVFIFLSVFIYLAVLIISLFRIFAKVSRK
ncbi:hypothetical protein JCM11491_002210 [Sporobolomyces phaffii]